MFTAFVLSLAMPLLGIGMGLPWLRRVKLRPDERVVAAAGVGLLAIFVLGFAAFACHFGAKGYWVVTAIAVVATLVQSRALLSLFKNSRAHPVLLGWLCILLAFAAFTVPMRHISAGKWAMDWFEHYQRTGYFLGGVPNGFMFIDTYALPARPPLQNVLTAWVCAHLGEEYQFAGFHLTSAVLASFVYLPCSLMAMQFVPRNARVRRQILCLLLAGVMILSPNIVAQALFPWTKLLSAFFVVAGLAIYLRTRLDLAEMARRRMTLAAILLAAACLVHYSACPFALLIGLHWFFYQVRERVSLCGLLLPPVAAAGILLLWIGWSSVVFSLKSTLSANSTVRDSTRLAWADNLRKFGFNFTRSVLPHPLYLTHSEFAEGSPGSLQNERGAKQNSAIGFVRDYTLLIYTGSFPLAAGSVGTVVLIAGLWADLVWRKPLATSSRRRWQFWRYFLLGGIVLGILEVGEVSPFGVAQVVWLPFMLLAIAYVVAQTASFSPALRTPVLLGWGFDALICTLPHLLVQTQTFVMSPTVADVTRVWMEDPRGLSYLALGQFYNQLLHNLHLFGDFAPDWQVAGKWLQFVVVLFAFGLVAVSLRRISRTARVHQVKPPNGGTMPA